MTVPNSNPPRRPQKPRIEIKTASLPEGMWLVKSVRPNGQIVANDPDEDRVGDTQGRTHH
jgi:hypothetical protein